MLSLAIFGMDFSDPIDFRGLPLGLRGDGISGRFTVGHVPSAPSSCELIKGLSLASSSELMSGLSSSSSSSESSRWRLMGVLQREVRWLPEVGSLLSETAADEVSWELVTWGRDSIHLRK